MSKGERGTYDEFSVEPLAASGSLTSRSCGPSTGHAGLPRGDITRRISDFAGRK